MDAVMLKDRLTANFSDEEFFQFCQQNKDLRIERTSDLGIVIMSPVSSAFSYYSGAAYAQLFNWSLVDKRGLAFDSSAGFTLPDRSVLSPDASWVSKEKWKVLSNELKNQFAPVAPEFIIEVRSKTDDIEYLFKKIKVWMDNGTEEAWLIDPLEKKSYVHFKGELAGVITGFSGNVIEGRGIISSFRLDLSLLEIPA